jgi:exopolysaccharide biosynthesis polyprenyl glycosylphosphotransferase
MFPEKRSALLHISNRWYHRVLQPVFDILGLVFAWRLTLELRLLLNPVMSQQISRADIVRLAPPLGQILLLWLVVLPWLGLYRREPGNSVGNSLLRVAQFAIVSSTLTIVAAFFSRHFGQDLSRSLVLLFAPLSFVTLMAARYTELFCCAAIDEVWPVRERLAVLGEGAEARRIVDVVQQAHSGIFAGVILPEGGSREEFGSPVPVLGTTRQLAEVINRVQLNHIIVVEGRLPQQEAEECARISQRMDVIVSRAIGLPGGGRLGITQLYGIDLLEIRPVAFTRGQEIAKRAFDIVSAAVTLALLSPLLAVLGLLVKATSSGPVFYLSKRVGKGGRHFTFMKFRSMRTGMHRRQEVSHDNEKNGHIFKIKNDPRITGVGRFMRKYSLDELPQLINVLRGEMSLVGPRPLPAEDLDPDGQSRKFAVWSEQRSRVLPGISGLWQISGRSDTTFEQMTELDIDYIRNWSLKEDLRILLVTPLVVITGRGAY